MRSNTKKFDMDFETSKREVVIETYRSRGPGGQRKNKTETAVRLRHIPSEITVIATEHRLQSQNLRLAFERLQERLRKLNQPKKRRIPTSIPSRVIKRKHEEKQALSLKKRLRQKPSKELEEWN